QRIDRIGQPNLTLGEIIAAGNDLADLLFPPSSKVLELFFKCAGMCDSSKPMRIRLRLDSYALANLPWEYVHIPGAGADAGWNRFFALNQNFSLVRYEMHHEERLATLGPLSGDSIRFLLFLSDPGANGYPPLDLDPERQHVKDALAEWVSPRCY